MTTEPTCKCFRWTIGTQYQSLWKASYAFVANDWILDNGIRETTRQAGARNVLTLFANFETIAPQFRARLNNMKSFKGDHRRVVCSPSPVYYAPKFATAELTDLPALR